ncbi:hypothetical protein PG999_010352 [Apiospora kogelbergensis]|uniref:Uncharacterized protein n=1 Tax=Apiospora kogelbergensis TaxID=1337665 RepID=A0AAW0Q9T9_9PEZI
MGLDDILTSKQMLRYMSKEDWKMLEKSIDRNTADGSYCVIYYNYDSESVSPWVFPEHNTKLDVFVSQPQLMNEVNRSSSSSRLASSLVPMAEPKFGHPPDNDNSNEAVKIGTVSIYGMEDSEHGREGTKLDWALIQLNNTQHWTANEVIRDESSSPEQILKIAAAAHLENGEMTVVAGFTGVSRGCLRQSPTTLRLGYRSYEVHEIVVENHLVRGDSGAWVIRDGKFCGHIIAQRRVHENQQRQATRQGYQ